MNGIIFQKDVQKILLLTVIIVEVIIDIKIVQLIMKFVLNVRNYIILAGNVKLKKFCNAIIVV